MLIIGETKVGLNIFLLTPFRYENFGVKSMAQDTLAQDSMTNDFYLHILCVEQP